MCNLFIYYLVILLSKVNVYIISFLMLFNKEKIFWINFFFLRCVVFCDVKILFILICFYLVDVYMYFFWYKILKLFEVCLMMFFLIFFFLENKYLEKEVLEWGIDIICNKLGKKSY